MKADMEIIDRGRGPQLSTSRITILDIFYYLHRGHDFEVVHGAMPTLTREEFDIAVDYIEKHHDDLVQRDRRAEEFIRQGVEAQRARGGIFAESEENLTTEERVARLKAKLRQRRAEGNGAGHSD